MTGRKKVLFFITVVVIRLGETIPVESEINEAPVVMGGACKT